MLCTRRVRSLPLLALFVLSISASPMIGCATAPPPALSQIPQVMAGVTLLVTDNVNVKATPEMEQSRSKAEELPSLIRNALLAAGYKVAANPTQPFDVEIKLRV